MSNKVIASVLVVGIMAVADHALAATSSPHTTSTPVTTPAPSSTTDMQSTTSSSTQPSTTPRLYAVGMAPIVDAQYCMLTVTMDRENAVSGAFNRLSDSQRAALSTRAAALDQAITNSTRHTIADAIDNAWNSYRRSRKNNVKTYREELKTIWSQYENQISICKKMGPLKATDKGSADDEKLED